jgi:hypothetical protein
VEHFSEFAQVLESEAGGGRVEDVEGLAGGARESSLASLKLWASPPTRSPFSQYPSAAKTLCTLCYDSRLQPAATDRREKWAVIRNSLLSAAAAILAAPVHGLVQAPSPAGAQKPGLRIDVGTANWASFPPLKAKPRELNNSNSVKAVERMFASGQCKIPGQTMWKFDITIPFAVMVEPDGKVSRVLVSDMGCAPLERMVGELAYVRSMLGDFQPTGEAKGRWYSSSVNFNLS